MDRPGQQCVNDDDNDGFSCDVSGDGSFLLLWPPFQEMAKNNEMAKLKRWTGLIWFILEDIGMYCLDVLFTS